MSDFDYQQIDDVIHSRIRLAIMSVLITVDEIEFTTLRNLVKTTDGNLSISLKKLEEAGYIKVTKQFVDRKPVTTYGMNQNGKKAFAAYIESLEKLIKK